MAQVKAARDNERKDDYFHRGNGDYAGNCGAQRGERRLDYFFLREFPEKPRDEHYADYGRHNFPERGEYASCPAVQLGSDVCCNIDSDGARRAFGNGDHVEKIACGKEREPFDYDFLHDGDGDLTASNGYQPHVEKDGD